jgi:sulfonate transport system substrate-binding protein
MTGFPDPFRAPVLLPLPALPRRTFLAGAGAALLAGCTGTAKADALRVAITGKGENDLRLLFATAGIVPDFPIHYADFESGHLVVEALNSASLDVGGMSEIPPVFAAASTIQSFRQVAVYHGDVNNQAVIVPRGSGLRTLADLKGKRVGYVRATTTQYFLIRMLESVGLGWTDIEPVAMTVADGAAAFGNGSLDAWAIYGFPIQRALATQGARVLRTALGFRSGNYILAAHKDAVADPQRAAWIGRFLHLTQQGFAWAADNQTVWAGKVAASIGVPVALVNDQFARRSDPFTLRRVSDAAIASEQGVADVFARAGLVGRVDMRPLWDARFNPQIKEA